MEILSATFVENIELRQAEGGATRIDLSGVHFSVAAPSPPPVTIEPHLVVLVRCREGESDFSALEVVFTNEAGDQVARSVIPFQVEPGKFSYRLVRAELTYEDYGTIEAHCQLDDGPETVVPLTMVPR
jgi:hypothetical protein